MPGGCTLQNLVPTQVLAISKVLIIYLLIVSGLAIGNILVTDISTDGLRYELANFVDHYKGSTYWWLTSLVASIIALTVGTSQNLIMEMVILAVFFGPALYYFNYNYPFSLDLNFRARTETGKTAHGRNEENIVRMGADGQCSVELTVQTGSNIKEFCLDIESPEGIKPRNIPTKVGDLELTPDGKITGNSAPGRDKFSFDLYLQDSGQIVPGRNILVIKDDESGRTLETIRVLPSR